MPTVIIVANGDLDSYYNYIMQYLDAKYHQFPTNFQDYHIADEVASQISSLSTMASHVDEGLEGRTAPLGKLVL